MKLDDIQSKSIHLGIDLGGTKTEIAAITLSGECLIRHRISTPKATSCQNQYDAILSAINHLVTDIESRLGQSQLSLGIGIPGSIDKHTGLVKNANTVCLIGQSFKQDLEKRLARQITIENDANCFAFSEARLGIGKDIELESLFAVILGTGVGGAWVINGQIITGANAIAGEWGHNPLPWADKNDTPMQNCYCGKQGCLETYLSGPGCATMAKAQYDEPMDSHFIFMQRDNNHLAKQAYQDYCRRLAKSLAHIVNVMDPDCIVLGGGLSNISSLYKDIPTIWRDYIFSAGSNTPIKTQLVQNKLGDSSGVFGAALLGASRVDANQSTS